MTSLYYCPKCDLGFLCFGGYGQVDPDLTIPMKRENRGVPPRYREAALKLGVSDDEVSRWLDRLSAAITVYRVNRLDSPRLHCPADGSICQVVDRFQLGDHEFIFGICTCGFGVAERSDPHYGWKSAFHWHFDRKGRMVLGELPPWFSTESRELQEKLKRIEEHPLVKTLFNRS